MNTLISKGNYPAILHEALNKTPFRKGIICYQSSNLTTKKKEEEVPIMQINQNAVYGHALCIRDRDGVLERACAMNA